MSKTYSYNNFTGWIASWPYYQRSGEFTDGANLDFRSNPPLLTTTNKSTLVATTGEDITTRLDGFWFGDDGGIHFINGVKVGQMTVNKQIVSACCFWEYYYWFYKGTTVWSTFWVKVARIKKTEALKTANSRNTQPSYTESFEWDISFFRDHYEVTSWTDIYSINSFWYMYVAHENKVVAVDHDEIVEFALTDLSGNVVWLAEFGTIVNVFLDSGDVLFRDGVSDSFSEQISFVNGIDAVQNMWDYSLIVSNEEVRVLQWYQRNKIFDYLNDVIVWPWNPQNNFAIMNGVTYFPSKTPHGIASHWAMYAGYTKAINIDLTTLSDGKEISDVKSIYRSQEFIYMSVKAVGESNYRIEKWKPENNEAHTNGFVVLKTFDAGVPTVKKVLKEIQISGYVSTSSSIKISYVKNEFTGKRRPAIDSTVYEEIFTIANSDEPMHLRRFGTPVGIDFYDIQLKVELESNAQLMQIDLIYDFIKQ